METETVTEPALQRSRPGGPRPTSGSHFAPGRTDLNPPAGSRLAARLGAFVSLLAIVGLLLGVPVALALVVGWPLPTEIPAWDRLSDAFQRDGVPLEVLINGLTVVVWVAWAQLAWALGAETVALAKGRAARRAHIFPGTQLLARHLVASAALVVSSLGMVRPAVAAPLSALQEVEQVSEPVLRSAEPAPDETSPVSAAPATTAAASAAPSAPVTAQPAVASAPSEQMHVTERGDTFWGLAERYLGNGMRWREIRDRNVGRAVAGGRVLGANEDHIDVGWRLIVPVVAGTPGASASMTALPSEPLTAPPELAPPGTLLASLAEDRPSSEAPLEAEADADDEDDEDEEDDEVAAPALEPVSYTSSGAATASPPRPAAAPAAPAAPVQSAPPTSVTVQQGDHFWGLAERELSEAWGRPVTAEEVAPYWRSLVEANRDRLQSGDPDLIYPGEQFGVPSTPSGPGAPVPPPETAPPPAASPAAPGESPAPPPTETAPPSETPPDDEAAPTTTAPEEATSDETVPDTTVAEEETTTTEPDEAPPEDTAPDTTVAEDETEPDEAPPEETTVPDGTRSEDDEGALPDEAPPEATTVPPSEGSGSVAEPPAAPTTTIPPTTAPPATAPPTTVPPTTTAPPTTAAPSTTAPPTTEAAPDESSAPTTAAPSDESAAPTTTAAPSPSTSADGEGRTEVDGASGESAEDDDGDTSVPVAPVAATAALAGLVLAALARRRRSRSRSLRPGDIVEPRLADDIAFERGLAIAAADVLDVVSAASRALGSIMARRDLPIVTAVVVAPSRTVTVCFAEPCDAEAPFEPGRAPDRWDMLPEDIDYWLSRGDAVPVLDTLTAVGQTDDGDWVFLDLESLGAIELAGDPAIAAEVAQSMVAELSLQPLAEPMVDLTVVGMAELSPSVVEQGVVRVDQLDQDMVRQVERSADDTAALLQHHGLRSTAGARARGVAGDGLFVMVVAYGGIEPADPVLLERVAAAAAPGGRGVAVVAIGTLGSGATRVIVTGDGRAHIPRLGVTVNAARMARDDLDRVAELLAREPELSTRGTPRRPVEPDEGLSAEPSASGPRVAAPYLEPTWRYLVRIFADHRVETPEGQMISFRYGDNPDVPNKNTHRGPELLAYLALSGRAASATDVRDHLWWDRPVALGTVNKLLYGTRKVLGGADLLSLAQDDPVGRYRLSPEVVTDVELLSHALEHAHAVAAHDPDTAVEVLRAHLEGIDAVAFRTGHLGQGLAEWAAAYRVIDRVEQPVIDAALLVAKLSTEAGPDGYRDALWAVDQGLTACPINEALVRAAMEIEARMGSTEAVNNRYLTLATTLARDELEPETETSDLRARLGGSTQRDRGGRRLG